jgi:hypothetical protein
MKKFLLALLLVIVSAAGAWAVTELDATVPANNSLISTFAGYERETRAKINEIIANIPDIANWTVVTVAHTATAGDKLLVNTSAAACTVTLPATPTAGDFIYLADAKGTWATYNTTLSRNGSMINGAASNYTLSTSGVYYALYVDAGYGWLVTAMGTSGSGDLMPTGIMKLSSYTYTDFKDVIAAISTTPGILLIDKDMTLSTSVSVPSTLKLLPLPGYEITVGSGKVLTLDSPDQILAAQQQVFIVGACTGVVFSRAGTVYPEWWGAVPDGATDSATAINCALNCMPLASPTTASTLSGGKVQLSGGTYSVASALLAAGPGLNVVGTGSQSTIISATSALGSGTVFTFDSAIDSTTPGWQIQEGWALRDLAITTNHPDTSGVRVAQSFLRRNLIENIRVKVTSTYIATNTGTGILDDAETSPGFSNGATIRNCDIWGFKYGVRIRGTLAGGTHIVRNHIQGEKTVSGSVGVYIESGNDHVITDNYFESWDYAIKNYAGYYTMVSHNFIEGGSITTLEYDDNGTGLSRGGMAQAYLLSNGWYDCTKVSAEWATLRNEACAHTFTGRKSTSGRVELYGQKQPYVAGHSQSQADKTVNLFKLGGLYHASGDGNGTDPFGTTIVPNWYHSYLASDAYTFSLGTTANANHPVQFYTGSVLRAALNSTTWNLHLDDGGGTTYSFLTQMNNQQATDPWGDNPTAKAIRPYVSLTAPYWIEMGPVGDNVNHGLGFKSYGTASLGHYNPLKMNGHGIYLKSDNIPTAYNSSCTVNQFAIDDNGSSTFYYYCYATDSWSKLTVPHTSW